MGDELTLPFHRPIRNNKPIPVHRYDKAAEQDNAAGQYNMALCYQRGSGVETNETLALQYFVLAADQGYALAMCSLGECARGSSA